jgi:hypothetical protein
MEKAAIGARIESLDGRPKRDDLEPGFVGDPLDAENGLICTVLNLSAMEVRLFVRCSTDRLPLPTQMVAGLPQSNRQDNAEHVGPQNQSGARSGKRVCAARGGDAAVTATGRRDVCVAARTAAEAGTSDDEEGRSVLE